MVVSQRLLVTNWTAGLVLAVFLTLIGIVLGLAFGLSRFRARTVALLAAAYTLSLIPLLAGVLFNDGTAWPERLLGLAGRLATSFNLFVSRRPVPDTILFVAFISICSWIISLTAGYALTRAGNFLGAILPAGVVLFIIQLYDNAAPDRAAFLAVYIFLSLLLLGRLTYIRKKFFWKEHKVWYSSEAAADLNLSILIISLVLIFVTWLAPASDQPIVTAKKVWDRLSQPFQQTRRDLGNAISGLQAEKSQRPINFYGSDLTLGQQASGGTDMLFKVRIPRVQTVARYYWRVRTYDEYLNGGWHTTGTSGIGFSPNHPLDAADTGGLPTGEFIFVFPDQSIATLITPPRPVWVSYPSILTYVPALDKQVEPVLFEAEPPVKAGQKYTVHSVVDNPSVLDLQSAGTAYPGWVRSLYLQLPADLPPSLPDLARLITGDAATPYDAAEAITQYLRDNITYQKTIPSPPQGQDKLAWFLFDYKAGYCNYYASAEVILLRTLGIPARLAVGYATGEFQSPDQYIVREEDAHAWPEVYFPGIGWTEFEPTVSQPPLERPSGILPFGVGPIKSTPVGGEANETTVPEEPTGGEAGTASGSGRSINSLLYIYILAGFLIAVIVSVWVGMMFGLGNWVAQGFQRVFHAPLPVLIVNGMGKASLVPPRWLERWAKRASLTPIERSFGVVYRSLQRLGLPATPDRTPKEAALALSQHLPAAAGEIQVLLDQFHANLFSEKPGDLILARRAAEFIRRQSLRTALRDRLAAVKRFLRMTR